MEASSTAKRPISAAFTYAENYVNLYGSRLHYIDVGAGDPFLFLHGNPTWSYCWRNIIPHLEPLGRCIAPDFVGFGKSDHPDIEYRIFDQIRYIEEFVIQLGLRNITLVVHDWGALVGLNLARRFPERVRAVAFCEFPLKPLGTLQETWPLIAEEFAKFRSPELGPELLMAELDRGECAAGCYRTKAHRRGDESLSRPVPGLGLAPCHGPASARLVLCWRSDRHRLGDRRVQRMAEKIAHSEAADSRDARTIRDAGQCGLGGRQF
jgi:pimeloyl-ACP methyl ester carboxylesterase